MLGVPGGPEDGCQFVGRGGRVDSYRLVEGAVGVQSTAPLPHLF